MNRLFELPIRVRLNAPASKYHAATGTVDAHELERVRGKDKPLTFKLADGTYTIAFGDELEAVDSTTRGTGSDKTQSPTPEAQP